MRGHWCQTADGWCLLGWGTAMMACIAHKLHANGARGPTVPEVLVQGVAGHVQWTSWVRCLLLAAVCCVQVLMLCGAYMCWLRHAGC